MSIVQFFVGFRPAVFGSGFFIIINFHDVTIKKVIMTSRKVIMMLKLELRTAGIESTKIRHVDTTG